MALESGNEKAIIISCDITSFNNELVNLIREKFSKLTDDISPEMLIMGATHTHTSVNFKKGARDAIKILNEFLPDGKKYSSLVTVNDEVITPEEATEFLADRISTAAKKAWDNRKEALVANAFGRAAIGFCRRVSYDDGSAQMWGDTNTANFEALEGGNDSGVELLYTFDSNKKLTGVVAMLSLTILDNSVQGKAFAMIYGIISSLAQPLETVIIPILVGDLFGQKSFNKILGIFITINTAGFALGSPVINFVYDKLGSYKMAFLACGIMMILVILLMQFAITMGHKLRKDVIESSEPLAIQNV